MNANFVEATSTVTTVISDVSSGAGWSNATTTFTDITNWSGSLTTTGRNMLIHVEFTYYQNTAGGVSDFRVAIGSNYFPSSTGWRQYTNEASSHKMNARTLYVTGVASGTYTVKIQGAKNVGTVSTDANDWARLTVHELNT